VKANEELVTDGFDKLQSGSKIAIRKTDSAGAAPSSAAAPTPTPTDARE
jgi:hypothetical protein